MNMKICLQEGHISINGGREAEIKSLYHRLIKADAKYVLAPLYDYDEGTWFADLDMPAVSAHVHRITYLLIRAQARALGCKMYLDNGFLRIRGASAHDQGLLALCSALTSVKRIRLYTSSPRSNAGDPEPSISIKSTERRIS